MIKIIGSLLLMTMFFGCTKNEESNMQIFKGKVIDYTTNLPVANAIVYVERADTRTRDFYNQLINPIKDSTITDATGKYELKLNKIPRLIHYELSAIKDGYSFVPVYCGMTMNIPQTSGSNTTYTDNLYIDKSSFISVLLNNTLPANSTDTLKLTITHTLTCTTATPPSPGLSYYFTKEKEFTGIITNQVFADTFSLKGNPSVKLEW